ncbi:hypothetical protein FTO70_14865 [Methanosarcina sp. KYL-1]|nr:hypothetical protein [Methanosarcina sp. KYL-1]
MAWKSVMIPFITYSSFPFLSFFSFPFLSFPFLSFPFSSPLSSPPLSSLFLFKRSSTEILIVNSGLWQGYGNAKGNPDSLRDSPGPCPSGIPEGGKFHRLRA